MGRDSGGLWTEVISNMFKFVETQNFASLQKFTHRYSIVRLQLAK
jgi:hypothetical protein